MSLDLTARARAAAGAPSAGSHGIAADKPVIRISAGRKSAMRGIRELWTNRELLYFLAWRDVKVRYKQTAIGVGWAILQPVLTMLLFSIFFGVLVGVPSEGKPYPLFVYAGLLPWGFFSNAVSTSGESLVTNSALITKVYFPRMVIPAAAVTAGLVDLAIASAVFIPLMFWYGVYPGPQMAMLVPLVMLTTLLAFAVGTWLSAINIRYRDVRHAAPFLLQLWMYATPVIYPASVVPQRWRWVLSINPLTGLIEGFRTALLGGTFKWSGLLVSAGITAAALVCSWFVFQRAEGTFADIV